MFDNVVTGQLSDGILLLNLLQCLTPSVPAFNNPATNPAQKIQNIALALHLLQSCGIDIRINPEEIMNNSPVIILPLMWRLIVNSYDGVLKKGDEIKTKSFIMNWVQTRTAPFNITPQATSDFGDGLSLMALISSYKPNLMNYLELKQAPKELYLLKLFEVCEELGIPTILSPSDFDKELDERSLFTLLFVLYHVLTNSK